LLNRVFKIVWYLLEVEPGRAEARMLAKVVVTAGVTVEETLGWQPGLLAAGLKTKALKFKEAD
jgi:hypothetical protein